MNSEELTSLLDNLRKLSWETEWVEFKHNKAKPEEIGEYISALSNSACLFNEKFGYMVWGIEDETHEVIGTTFNPNKTKEGNQQLESWLLNLLTPRLDIRFYSFKYKGLYNVIIMEVPAATGMPSRFKEYEYIRVGSNKKKLKEYPKKEQALWQIFDVFPFEKAFAFSHLSEDRVLYFLDYSKYFELISQPLPSHKDGILEKLEMDELIVNHPRDGWSITNLGSILFAKNLQEFTRLKRKALRIIH